MGATLRIGRLAGIPIGINVLWLFIVALITWALGADYYPERVDGISPLAAYLLGLLSALLLFASILLHELGHSIVARRHGMEIEEIDLWLLGGVARMSGAPRSAEDELRFAIAGPAVTAAIAALFAFAYLLLPEGAPQAVDALIAYQLYVNVAILIFNMLPAFPLDGGRVLRALAWRHSGDHVRASSTAAAIGRAFGFGFVGLGILTAAGGAPGGLWLALIGLFIVFAGSAEQHHAEMRDVLAGHTAGELAHGQAVTAAGRMTVDEAVHRYFGPYGYTAFPVRRNGGVIGLVTVDSVASVPAAQRRMTTVEQIAERDPQLFIDRDEDASALLDRPAFHRIGRAVVTGEGAYVGVVSITDVQRSLRSRRLETGGA
jgi:Zn-dependent protease/CBS domain-containing protein